LPEISGIKNQLWNGHDRVEIENTGHLPEKMTVDTIKQSHHSYPQNPTIADVLFKTGRHRNNFAKWVP
jgi:hypothetical protein